MQATVAQIRSNMALTGATWSDFVHLGAKSFPVASLLSGTDYYAFAFGLDRGAITTDISKKPFRTAAAELTDDCTFDIRFVEIGASTVDVEIVPSNSSTRYYATFMESSILETHTPDEVAAMKISEEEGWQTDWVNDPRIHSGTQTLNSNSDLGIAPFKPQHDYTVFVFGVSAEGEERNHRGIPEVRHDHPNSGGRTDRQIVRVEFHAFGRRRIVLYRSGAL